MDLSVGIRNFKVIKTAKLKFPTGITLISAPNGSGKSTVLKGLKTVLDGSFGGEDNKRHGCDSYALAIRVGEQKLVVTRKGSTTSLKYQDEPEVSKLGRGSLRSLEPRFPLQRVEYEDTSFYPNFSFQNKVPIFDDISVFDLFSSMFSSVSQVSSRLDKLKKECTDLNKNLNETEANLKYTGEQLVSTQASLEAFIQHHSSLDTEIEQNNADYQNFMSLTTLQQQMSAFEQEPGFLDSLEMYPLVDSSRELFPVLDFVDDVEKTLKTVLALKASKSSLQDMPDFDFELLIGGTTLHELKSQVDGLTKKLEPLQQLNFLLEGQEVVDLRSELFLVQSQLEETSTRYKEAFDEVSKTGCPYKHLGICK